MSHEPKGMTTRERSDLQQLARMNARVAKADVDAVAAQRLAEFEQEITRDWTTQELFISDLVDEVKIKVAEINALIDERCEAEGIRPELRPIMGSGPYLNPRLRKDRELELRRLARTELDAAAKRAKTEIDRQTASICGEIVASGLTSADAHAMLSRVDTADALVPSLEVSKVEALLGRGR